MIQQFRYKLDYKVKVPRNTNIHVLAINAGHISIDNIQSNLIYAQNINGEMKIKTVNGDIVLNYLNKHIENGHFKSGNGSFDINFVEQSDIEVTYKTLNGHLYTSFDSTEISFLYRKNITLRNKAPNTKLSHKKQ